MLDGSDHSVMVEIVGVIMSIFAAIWSLAWWLSGKFTKVSDLIYSQVEKLETHFTSKLEYHERHDDNRFNNISNDLLEIKLRNAAIRGLYINTDDKHLNPVSKKVKKLFEEEI